MTESWQDIPGRHALKYICNDALKDAPRGAIFVEVGCALGKGIAYMHHAVMTAGRDDIQLYAVDPWGGYGRNGEQQAAGSPTPHGDWQLFLQSIPPHVLDRLHILRCPSVKAALTFPRQSVWCCIIDADHSYQAVNADIAAWLPTIASGGWIGGDDHENDFPGVEQACKRWFPEGYESGAVEDGWSTWRKRIF